MAAFAWKDLVEFTPLLVHGLTHADVAIETTISRTLGETCPAK